MKQLLLIRHAKSSWDHPELADMDRPLNKRGKRDAPFMGRRLMKKGLVPDLILSSPAKRACKTAKRIASALEFSKKNIRTVPVIYWGPVEEILEEIHTLPDNVGTVYLVGHNPDISELIGYFLGKSFLSVPTSGMAMLEFKSQTWGDLRWGSGALLYYEYPKMFKRSGGRGTP